MAKKLVIEMEGEKAGLATQADIIIMKDGSTLQETIDTLNNKFDKILEALGYNPNLEIK